MGGWGRRRSPRGLGRRPPASLPAPGTWHSSAEPEPPWGSHVPAQLGVRGSGAAPWAPAAGEQTSAAPAPPGCGHRRFGVPLAQHPEPQGAPAIAPLLSLQRSDPRLLSQFFFADERVTRVVAEINGLDAELDPQQYLVLLNQLHLSQVRGQPRPRCDPGHAGWLWVTSLPSPGSPAGHPGADHGGVHPHTAAQPRLPGQVPRGALGGQPGEPHAVCRRGEPRDAVPGQAMGSSSPRLGGQWVPARMAHPTAG